ncbi:MAG: 4-hydroxy-3-methylbut-2-enyl diphosphate reductase [Muribaculaceae bacterium]|nr:4-hydroxy-3-methylbut-2-enyl diphosphate reductase [Muribaculaceae bacterium]
MNPVVDIDSFSGFCFGVTAAINKAEEELSTNNTLYCLGDIVHNSAEMERLSRKGLVTITHEDLSSLRNARVMLRAHGEPPSTYHRARLQGITLVDATCPVVLKLQQRIKADYDNARNSGHNLQIVIYGQSGHAEVNGLVGQTEGSAIVIESPDQIHLIDMSKDIVLYSQTTKSLEGFNAIVSAINTHKDPQTSFKYYDTICRQVANRVEQLKKFASTHDVVLFVASEQSSNGKVLCNHCKSVNDAVFMLATPDKLDPQWLKGAKSIGICGATSTPRWLMDNVADKVRLLTSGKSSFTAE